MRFKTLFSSAVLTFSVFVSIPLSAHNNNSFPGSDELSAKCTQMLGTTMTVENEIPSFNDMEAAQNLIDTSKDELDKGFSNVLGIIARSPTFSALYKSVLGIDLGQFGSTTLTQIQRLYTALNIQSGERVLDEGSGTGRIAKWISDQATEAHIVGIDIASGAVRSASEATKNDRERISFQVMDMDRVSFPPHSINKIYATDTLYFVRDLTAHISKLKEILAPNGRMAFYYNDYQDPIGTKASETNLGRALSANGLSFSVEEFTEEEIKVWSKLKEEIEGVYWKSFHEEGTFMQAHALWEESREMLKYLKEGHKRYLYTVH